MTRLVLVRHGETDWNVAGRWQGQADVPLNVRGREQALETARKLKDIRLDAIYASDLSRAYETAQAIARERNLPVRTDPRLREIDQGQWQGMLVDEIQARFADLFELRRSDPLNVAPPGGETVLQVRNRVVEAIEQIVREHPGQTVAVVSHGFAIAVALVHYRDLPVEMAWQMIPDNGGWEEIRTG